MMPRKIRDRRRTLHFRHLLVKQMVQMKNRVSGLLMETGVEHNKSRLESVAVLVRIGLPAPLISLREQSSL